jgi:uncharacterized protein with beta-barrel porin domain
MQRLKLMYTSALGTVGLALLSTPASAASGVTSTGTSQTPTTVASVIASQATATAVVAANGTTTITSGTLTIDNSQLVTSSTPIVVQSGASASISGTLAAPLTVSGGSVTVATNGFVTQPITVTATSGTPAVTLSSTNSLTSSLTVQPGANVASLSVGTGTKVSLNGTAGTSASDLVTVSSGAALRGTGTVAATLNVGGILAPGNSPGTLTFSAPITQQAGSALSLDIDGTGTANGAGNYSRLVGTGSAASYTIGANTTIQPNLRGISGSATNTYTPSLGTDFTVVQAPGGVSGQFTTLSQPSSGLAANTKFAATYGSTTVDLFVVPTSYLPYVPMSGLTGFGTALNTIASGGASSAMNGFYSLSAGQIPTAIRQLAPPQLGAEQIDVVRTLTHMNDAAIERHAVKVMDEVQTGSAVQPSNLWAQVSGGAADRSASGSNADGYSLTGYGFTVGGDYLLAPSALAGASFAYNRGNSSGTGDATGNKMQLDAYVGTLYTAWSQGPLSLGGQASVGHDDFSQTHGMALAGLAPTANYGGMQYGVRVNGGYDLALGGAAVVTPGAEFRYLHLDTDSYTETGAGPLNLTVSSRGIDAVETAFGAKIAWPIKTSMGDLAPSLKAAWVHSYNGGSITTNAQLQGVAFQTSTPRIGSDGLELTAGMQLSRIDNFSLRLEYDGEFRSHYTSNAGLLNVRYGF